MRSLSLQHKVMADKPDIRVIRRKDVSDVMRSVVQDKTDLPEVEASLNRLFNRANKSEHLYREVLSEVLGANMALARMVKRLADTVTTQHAEITILKTDVAHLKTLTT